MKIAHKVIVSQKERLNPMTLGTETNLEGEAGDNEFNSGFNA